MTKCEARAIAVRLANGPSQKMLVKQLIKTGRADRAIVRGRYGNEYRLDALAQVTKKSWGFLRERLRGAGFEIEEAGTSYWAPPSSVTMTWP